MIEEKRLDLLINLGSYKLRYVLIRLLMVSAIAALLLFVVRLISPSGRVLIQQQWGVYLFAIIAYNTVTEMNIFIMRLLSRSRWRQSLYIQTFSVALVSVFALIAVVLVSERVFGKHNVLAHDVTKTALIIGWLVIIIHLLVIIISNMAKEWMENRKEIDELKEAKLISDYNSLKDRLNPHFLFNNLSTLKSLIRYNPEIAEEFTQDFTNVYRYVLKSHEETTVSLQEELHFMESYIALHKERIGEGLDILIRIDPLYLEKRLPPMALQLLVENAIKHNIANKQHPLMIEIFSKKGALVVKNNLNPKESTYSTHTGLVALESQYRLITDGRIRIEENDQYYIVELPLIE